MSRIVRIVATVLIIIIILILHLPNCFFSIFYPLSFTDVYYFSFQTKSSLSFLLLFFSFFLSFGIVIVVLFAPLQPLREEGET